MLEGASSLSQADGHWLAGFIEAEGSFFLRPSNAGQTWTCGFELSQRDDEWDLLTGLQDQTGLGVLRPRAAVGNARPQILWSIGRQCECRALVELLGRFPLRGRKRREFEVWARAVEAWVDITGPARWAAMRDLALELRSRRIYAEPPRRPKIAGGPSGTGFEAFIGGFVTGEGCLLLNRQRPRLIVKVRRDDRRLLEEIQSFTGLGYIRDGGAYGASQPTSSWIVLRDDELVPLASLLTGKLRGRRARELRPWAAAASEFARARSAREGRNPEVVSRAVRDFTAARAYAAPAGPPRRRSAEPPRKQAMAEALQEWAATREGPLSCSSYASWRKGRAGAPTRNTITNTFGSWSAALRYCGLEGREASTEEMRLARDAGRNGARTQARKQEHRSCVASAVARLARELGVSPTASQYFRWRLAHEPHLPSQATTYRLFPGGWAAVLDAAESEPQPLHRSM